MITMFAPAMSLWVVLIKRNTIHIMITGEIKNQIDQIWDTFFVAGVTNPITVLEQMTYIFL